MRTCCRCCCLHSSSSSSPSLPLVLPLLQVYAVEATDMAKNARKLVAANKLDGVVEVIQGTIETIQLPEQVRGSGCLVARQCFFFVDSMSVHVWADDASSTLTQQQDCACLPVAVESGTPLGHAVPVSQ